MNKNHILNRIEKIQNKKLNANYIRIIQFKFILRLADEGSNNLINQLPCHVQK